MLVTTQWPLKHSAHLTSLVWICVLWRPGSLMELSALWTRLQVQKASILDKTKDTETHNIITRNCYLRQSNSLPPKLSNIISYHNQFTVTFIMKRDNYDIVARTFLQLKKNCVLYDTYNSTCIQTHLSRCTWNSTISVERYDTVWYLNSVIEQHEWQLGSRLCYRAQLFTMEKKQQQTLSNNGKYCCDSAKSCINLFYHPTATVYSVIWNPLVWMLCYNWIESVWHEYHCAFVGPGWLILNSHYFPIN